MTKSMLAGAAVAAATILCGGRSSAATFDADTLGFWTFDGTPGETFNGKVANQVSGSSLELYATTTNAANKTVYDPVYTNDVPSAYVFSDAAMTNCLGALTSSIRLRRGSANTVGGLLRIPEFGKAVLRNGEATDFTIEVIANFDAITDSQWGPFVGVSGATSGRSPTIVSVGGSTNGGFYGSLTNNENAVNSSLKTWYASAGSLFHPTTAGGYWRHVCLRYRHSDRRFSCLFDYNDHNVANASLTWQKGMDISLAEESIVSILGCIGKVTTCHPGAAVAVVRVVNRYLSQSEMLQVADKLTPDVLVHHHFNGVPGEKLVRCMNSTPNKMAVNEAVFSGGTERFDSDVLKGKPWTKSSFPERAYWENPTAASSVSSDVTNTTSCSMVFNPAFRYGSFTCEMMFKPLAYGGNGAPLFGPRGEGNNWGVSCNAAGQVRLRLYSQQKSDGTKGNVEVYNGKLAKGEWHHVAVSYDAATRIMKLYTDYTATPSTYTCVEGWDPWTPSFSSESFSISVTGGFNMSAEGSLYGLLDEFRFTRGVLTPDQFIHPSGGPGVLMLLR